MSRDNGFENVCCPIKGCGRKLTPINFSSKDELLGQLYCFCEVHLLVFYTESVYEAEPKVYLGKFSKGILLSDTETYETYQTVAQCLTMYIEFLDTAWNMKLEDSAYHLVYTHKKHLMKVLALVRYRMKQLDKKRL